MGMTFDFGSNSGPGEGPKNARWGAKLAVRYRGFTLCDFVCHSYYLLNLCAMFIRKRKLNKPASGLVLVLFLFASAFSQSSGTLSLYVIKAIGCTVDKSKQTKSSAFQYPCGATEEEKKGEHKSVTMSIQSEDVHSDPKNFTVITHYADSKTVVRTANSLFLINRTLRLWWHSPTDTVAAAMINPMKKGALHAM